MAIIKKIRTLTIENIKLNRFIEDTEDFEFIVNNEIRLYVNLDYEFKLTILDKLKCPFTIFFDSYRTKQGHVVVLGLNMHYLPPKLRMEAFRALLTTRNEKRYRKSTVLNFDWQRLKALSEHKLFKHAVKAYRVDHVRSVFVRIPSTAWQMALFLPVARWQNNTQKFAWKM